ncbi:hypothetical protein HC928_02900 [bacterium]|nr:hypothetical protein [bacterium]
MALINFSYDNESLLSIVENAINYAVSVTNNLLYQTNLNSPYRILVEAQTSVYNQFLIALEGANNELILMFLEIMGIVPQVAKSARVILKFEVLSYTSNVTYFERNFPVRATNGTIFLTNGILSIPSGTRFGFIEAVADREGIEGNLPPNSITQALRVIQVPFTVTNDSWSYGGTKGESLLEAQERLSQMVRRTGLVTESDYRLFVSERLESVVSLNSGLNQVEIYVCHANGELLTDNEFNELNSELQLYKPLGLETLELRHIDVILVFVEVIGSIRAVSDPIRVSNEINSILRSYLTPSNDRQVDENTSGIILINELERQINLSQIDFIQTVKIGLSESTAYGQNFIFDSIYQRVKLDKLKTVLIKDRVNYESIFVNDGNLN